MILVTRVFVVMGVSGAGKSTLGKALAALLGWDFVDADDLHSDADIVKMRSGEPLTDDDRAPWLARVRVWIADHLDRDRFGVVACSALKRRYRDVLRGAGSNITFIAFDTERGLLAERLAARTSHFMPASLLDSQLSDYEPPARDEGAILVDAGQSVENQLDTIIQASNPGPGSPRGGQTAISPSSLPDQ